MDWWTPRQGQAVLAFESFSLGRASLAFLVALLITQLAVAPASAGEGTWTRVGPPDTIPAPVAIDPANPDVLLAGIAKVTRLDGGVERRTDEGLFRSADGGRSWALVSSDTRGRAVRFVEFDPRDSRIVYASIDSCFENCAIDPSAFFLRSADGGASWSTVFHGSVNDVAIYPSDPKIVYIATGDLPSERGVMIPAASRSPGDLPQMRGYHEGRTALPPGRDLLESPPSRAAGEAAPDRSAAHALAATTKTLAKSVDRGLTWSGLTSPFDGYTWAIAVDPRDSTLILTSGPRKEELGGDSYRSTDGGKTWRRQVQILGSPEFAFDGSGSAVYASAGLSCASDNCPSGIVRSLDGGKTWRAVLSSTTRSYGPIVSSPSRPSEVFVVETSYKADGWYVNRVLHATSPRGSFSQVGSAIENANVSRLAVSQASPQTFYVTTNGGLYAYTLPASSGELPATGEPPADVLLPVLVGLAAALTATGLRVRSLHTS